MLQRRNFLATTGATVGFLGLQKYLRAEPTERVVSKYGDLIPDPEGILDLPKGFSYQIISRAGEIMSDALSYLENPTEWPVLPVAKEA